MKEDIDIDAETTSRREMEEKKKKRNVYGIYIGLAFIVIGFVWYAINMGLIPLQYLESWPQILIIVVGILILIKSL
ncbi:hypothetical protein [Methanobacterium alcaliphilum]|uniref:hypothetical protein n=1 Tax=Methanobacterium alcaliphilum TaxID=392018 RepID=UPI00200B0FF4|nr:hypothetical protein [Methanobacterium alcaliphilum]MCK9150637.1 hypothetical protein [Methanobacterium alcaliphilum]